MAEPPSRSFTDAEKRQLRVKIALQRTVKIDQPRAKGTGEQHDEGALSCLAVVVVDGKLRVKFSFFNGAEGEKARCVLCENDTQLRSGIAALVSPLLVRVSEDRTAFTPMAVNGDVRSLGISVMRGSGNGLFALVVETDHSYDSVSRAAIRFALTRRQTEVLALILEGASAGEIARTLSISEYTAQGYIKSLLNKTGARNRADMATRVLAWRRYRPASDTRPLAEKPRRDTASG